MPDDSQILRNLTNQVEEILGDGPSEERRMSQKKDLLSAISSSRRSSKGKGYWWAAAAVVVIAAASLVAILRTGNGDRPFWVGQEHARGVEGVLLKTPDQGELPIHFEGGSLMEVSRESAIRVVESRSKTVRVALNRGRLKARIKNNGKTGWQVQAGPYRVAVKGTHFSVDWNEKRQGLHVAVTKGIVVVTGAGLDDPGIRLTAGNHLQIQKGEALVYFDASHARDESASMDAASKAPSPKPTVVDEPEADEPEAEAPVPIQATRSRRHFSVQRARVSMSSTSEVDLWKKHYKDKDFKATVEAAERVGLSTLEITLDRDDLWHLANAARYAGRGVMAADLLLAFKRRFKESKRASTATFLLGRVALDLRGSPGEAQKWFRSYLDESPGGPLAEEALGRLMEACLEAREQAEAKRYAHLYLSRHPNGSFAVLARSVR